MRSRIPIIFAAAVAASLAPAAATAQTTVARVAVGVDQGVSAVRVFDVTHDDSGATSPTFTLVGEFIAFHPRVKGARVAVGDVNGDGVADIVAGAGHQGRSQVKVIDGTRLNDVDSHGQINPGALLADFYSFGRGFRGDVNVASGDVDNDGYDDVVVSAGPGSKPIVRVYDGGLLRANDRSGHNALFASFLAFDSHFRGGVSVAAGDQNGDGYAEVIAGARSNSIATVNVFDGAEVSAGAGEHEHSLSRLLAQPKPTNANIASFVAYDTSFTGGVLVAAGTLSPSGFAIFTGPSTPGDGTVRTFVPVPVDAPAPKPVFAGYDGVSDLQAYGAGFVGGVRVAAADLDGDGIDELLCASSAGTGVEDTINIATTDRASGALTLWGSFQPFGPKTKPVVINHEEQRSGFFVASKIMVIAV